MRNAASFAAFLLLSSPGCGSDQDGLFSGSSGSEGAGASGGAGASTNGAGASSSTGMTSSSMAAGTGGASSTGSGGAGGGCSQAAWYCDADQDGYGDPNVSEMACDQPPGGDMKCPGPYLQSNNDCGPGDASAHPDQMMFFAMPVLPPAPTPAFDYNCDGQEEKDPSQLYNGGMNMDCTTCFSPMSSHGYGPNAVCGGTTEYYRCNFSFGSCNLAMSNAPEPLRCR
jgi:hypothetical protein